MVSTWSIGGKTVQSLVINNKEVQSIVRNSDGKVLYEKASAHNYSIAFGQSSYTATGGACTISCTLLDNGSPVSGATVTVTGSDSSLYSSITNQSGVAVFNLTNLTTTITCTCTYANVSATCTVIVSVNPVMSYNLTSCTLIADSDVDVSDIILYAWEVELLEEFGFMQGHTLSDLNNTILTAEQLEEITGTGYSLSPTLSEYLIDDMESLYDGIDLTLYTPDNTAYSSNLYFITCFNNTTEFEYKVEYSATDSNNLTIRLTNTVIE